jgi:hypothetical protein
MRRQIMKALTRMIVCATLLALTRHASAETECPALVDRADVEAVWIKTQKALDAANAARAHSGEAMEELERLVTHLEGAMNGNAATTLDGLNELLTHIDTVPPRSQQLFGASIRIVSRLHRASEVSTFALVSHAHGPGESLRKEAYEHAMSAFEQFAALWRPISACYMQPYGL